MNGSMDGCVAATKKTERKETSLVKSFETVALDATGFVGTDI